MSTDGYGGYFFRHCICKAQAKYLTSQNPYNGSRINEAHWQNWVHHVLWWKLSTSHSDNLTIYPMMENWLRRNFPRGQPSQNSSAWAHLTSEFLQRIMSFQSKGTTLSRVNELHLWNNHSFSFRLVSWLVWSHPKWLKTTNRKIISTPGFLTF